MVAAFAAPAAPTTEAAAADRNAMRDKGSAFIATVVVFCVEEEGANADATARVDRIATIEIFILDIDFWE
jgi:predicted metallopeptidase